MITAEDIDAFKDDVETVSEFVRRSRKGIPEDRWTTGTNGAKRLAEACEGLLRMNQEYAYGCAAMLSQIEASANASIEVAKDPCRDD
jgi:hypothetical protein